VEAELHLALEDELYQIRLKYPRYSSVHVGGLCLTRRDFNRPMISGVANPDLVLLADNNGNFILRVSAGKGEVARGGRGELRLNIRGLSPLFTGLYTPQQLQFSGFLEASDQSLAIATQIFAGSSPWMPDFF